MTKLGFNVQYGRLNSDQKHGLTYYADRLNSSAHVVINNVEVAHALQARYPSAHILLRLMPQGRENDDNIHRVMTPFQFIDWYAGVIKDKRIIIYANNEPHPETDAEETALIQWLVDVGREAINRGFRIGLGNFSIGTPHETKIYKYRTLLEFLSANKGRAFLDLHEYMLQDWQAHGQWHVGRFNFWLDYCAANNIPEPDILVTEFGYDYIDMNGQRHGAPIHEVIRQFKEANYSGEGSAARRIVDAYKTHYAKADAIKGVCIFTWGADTDRWLPYDVSVLREFLEYLVTYTPKHNQPVTTLTTVPGNGLNFRVGPSLSAAVMDKLVSGTRVYLTGRVRSMGGYVWYEAYMEGRPTMPGWFARIRDLITNPPLPGEPVQEPEPEPQPEPEPVDNIKTARSALIQARALIDAALGNLGG